MTNAGTKKVEVRKKKKKKKKTERFVSMFFFKVNTT